MKKYFGEWVLYSRNCAIIHVVVFLVIAGAFTLFGLKFEIPLRIKCLAWR